MNDVERSKKVFGMMGKARRVLLLTDERKDGDTLGSSLSMFHYLRAAGKEVAVFSAEPLPEVMSFLPGITAIRSDDAVFSEPWDLVMSFDSSRDKYILKFFDRLTPRPPLVVVDHHASNPRFGDENLVDVQASSTCEVVFRFFSLNRISITPAMATCLMTGLVTDTGYFGNSATNDRALQAAAELVRRGADQQLILKSLGKTFTVASLMLLGRMLSRLVFNKRWGVALTFVTDLDYKELGLNDDVQDGLSEILKTLNVPAFIVLCEDGEGKIRGSCRTDGDFLDFVKFFGGGGHRKACGFRVPGHLKCENGIWSVVDCLPDKILTI